MSFITITKGGPTTDIPDGVYPVVLTGINGPKTVTARRGPNAGQDVDLLEWSFAVDGGPLNGYEISASSSTASGPRSKLYAFLTALFGGVAPAVGQGFDKEHLIGRQALATIAHDDGGWPIIANLGAKPTQYAAVAPAQPVAPTNTEAMVQRPTVNQRAPRQPRAMVETATVSDARGTRPLAPVQDQDIPF